MAPIIYGMAMSTCTRRVLTTLEEKGVSDYTLETVNLGKGEHKDPEYVKTKQPFGIIPVAKDGDLQIYESRAIMRYFAEKYAGQGTELLGETLAERALVNQWLEVEAQEYNPPLASLISERLFKPMFGGVTDEARAAELKAKFVKVLDIYEEQLAGKTYLANEKFSMADLSHLPYTHLLWAIKEDELITSRPNVARWWAAISSRPAWKKISSA